MQMLFPFISDNPFVSSSCVSVLSFCLSFWGLFLCSLPICTLCIFFPVDAYHQKSTNYVKLWVPMNLRLCRYRHNAFRIEQCVAGRGSLLQ